MGSELLCFVIALSAVEVNKVALCSAKSVPFERLGSLDRNLAVSLSPPCR